MWFSNGVLAGIFALAGVTVQFALGRLASAQQWRHERQSAQEDKRMDVYFQSVVQARRLQRMFKDEMLNGADAATTNSVVRELDHFSELNAMLRLIAPGEVSGEAIRLEDEMRRRVRSPGDNVDPLPISQLIELLREDVSTWNV